MDIFIKFFQYNLIYMIIVLIMYLCDTLSGFAKVFYKKNYQSEKARKSFSKLLVFISVIFAVMGIDILIQYSYPDFKVSFCPIICIAISLVELSSIGENLEDVTGKNFITELIKYIINTIKKLIGKEEKSQ